MDELIYLSISFLAIPKEKAERIQRLVLREAALENVSIHVDDPIFGDDDE